MHVVKIACELPDKQQRSLCQWDSQEIARQLVETGVVLSISADTVWRILSHHRLKPWRHHMWLSSTVPRDGEFRVRVAEICELYTRPLDSNEVVLCIDEKTSIQPRPRTAPTRPPLPGNVPTKVEHEYKRRGALNLVAAFDTRTGRVFGRCYDRKRQVEFIDFLEQVEAKYREASVIHVVLDNVRMHKGKEVQAWLAKHPRFKFHFTPVHCSWMNQVEQWFGVLQRKRLRIADSESKDDLKQKILDFITQHNGHAHPYNWNSRSVAKVMALCDRQVRAAG